MPKKPTKPRRRTGRNVPKFCAFCEKKLILNYKDNDTLSKYITERGKIISRTRTGTCAKHQRLLSEAIKRSRFLALLPFTINI